MKGLRWALLAIVVGLVLWMGTFARDALREGVGYSAKQLCSGVFVSGLPAEFITERDVLPRLAVLGPLRGLLKLQTELQQGVATAELLGVRATAAHRAGTGCALHGDGPGVAPLAGLAASAAVGVPAVLEQAFDAAFAEPEGGGRNTLAVLVSVGGELIAERYAPPADPGTRLQGWSMNKSLMATWVGMQAARGALDPAAPVAPQLQVESDTIDPALTLLHLLQMESGLAFSERYGPGSDVTRMLYRSKAMWRVPAALGHAYPPGEHFAYSSGDTVLASYLWQRTLDEPYPQWLAREFAAPLGLRSLVAEADANGTQVGSSYLYLTARDWLRVGQLWLDAWHGRSPLLAQRWLRESVAPRDSDAEGRYGRGFWLNTGSRRFPALPPSLFMASGNSGQYVVVVPEWELVVVRLGLTSGAPSGIGSLLAETALRLELPQ